MGGDDPGLRVRAEGAGRPARVRAGAGPWRHRRVPPAQLRPRAVVGLPRDRQADTGLHGRVRHGGPTGIGARAGSLLVGQGLGGAGPGRPGVRDGRGVDRPPGGGAGPVGGRPAGGRRPGGCLPVGRGRLECRGGPHATGVEPSGPHLHGRVRRSGLRRVRRRRGRGRAPGDRPHDAAGDRGRRRRRGPRTGRDLGRAVRRHVADPGAARQPSGPLTRHRLALGRRGRRAVRRLQPARLRRAGLAVRGAGAGPVAPRRGRRAGPGAPRRRGRRRPATAARLPGAHPGHQGGQARHGTGGRRTAGRLSRAGVPLGRPRIDGAGRRRRTVAGRPSRGLARPPVGHRADALARPGGLPARRHPHQGRPGRHGHVARDPCALPRPCRASTWPGACPWA